MTVYLVRHASAGRRNGADPHDGRRHLDEKGRRQASAVREHLAGASIEAVLSSPLPRCVETVEPLAEALGLEVRIDDRLREGSDPAEAWELVEEVAGGTTVLCSHGDLIPEVVRRSEARGMRMPGRTGFAKGSVWTLRGWDGTRFARGAWDKLR